MADESPTIDGVRVELRPGETVLAAARRIGIAIPTLCHVEGRSAPAGCRICLVEDERGDVLASCHTALRSGAKIRTQSDRLAGLRADVLRLQLDELGHVPPATELAKLCAQLGVAAAPAVAEDAVVDRSHAYLRFDRAACITCRRCVVACREVQGQFVYDLAGRGAATRLVYGPTAQFSDSPCVACGACVDACPTGALFDRDREAAGAVTVTESVCGYCGVGCRTQIASRAGEVAWIAGVPEAAVNRGHLCAKGRYAHGYRRHAERLTTPLVRDGDRLRPASWTEALDRIATGMRSILAEHGPTAIGAIASSRSTNEAAYLLQKLFRVLGSNNVDCCARVCHSSTALALQLTTGTGAASACYDDIELARCIVVAGANPTEAHPVVGARIKQAVLRGVPLVVVDPRRIELAEYATLHLRLRAGTNVALFNAIAALLLARGHVDRSYLDARTEGLAELEAALARLDLDDVVRITGVARSQIEQAADLLAGPTLFVHGLGLSEQTQGTASVMTLVNLGMATGSIGRAGAGMLPLRGQNNVQGAADMGAAPAYTVGYQAVDDPEVRARLGALWGTALPGEPGLAIPEMLAAARAGTLRMMWIAGEDVAQSDPDQTRVLEALGALDLLVVQDPFVCETALLADVVLPAAAVLEQEGTFTNGERRIQHVRAAVAPPGESRPDWAVCVELAQRLGVPWSYSTPAAVMQEIAVAAPRLFGGVRYDRLVGDGLQWPCREAGDPGTPRLHLDGFLRGRGRLVVVDHLGSPEHDVPGYPYLLVTGRVLHHYNVGTMTRRTPQRDLVARDVLEIHPTDAARDGIADGAMVRVESRWGAVDLAAQHSERVSPGTLFLSFHFPETHANRLVGPHHDPLSKCPAYKVTAVRVRSPGLAAARGTTVPA